MENVNARAITLRLNELNRLWLKGTIDDVEYVELVTQLLSGEWNGKQLKG
jgi:hypothetical protein